MNQERSQSELLAEGGDPKRVQFTHNGLSLNCEMFEKNGVIEIRVLPRLNNPNSESQVQKMFETSELTGMKFDVTSRARYRPGDADVGYLKASYIGAFAKFGYAWLFAIDSSPIRNQIQEPSARIVPNCRIGFDPRKQPAPALGFYFMRSPFSAVLVSIPPYGVVLPWPGGPSILDISNWVAERRAESNSGELSFFGFEPWPKGPEFILDRMHMKASGGSD